MHPNKNVKIGGHNEKILETAPPPEEKLCNSLKKENYLMRGACLIENVLNYAKTNCGNGKYKPEMYKKTYQTTKLPFRNVT